MNEIVEELANKWEVAQRTITTRELADVLGVDVKTIQRAVDSLDINVARVGSNHTMVFTEEQATAIKIAIENHSKVNALTPKTTLEKQLIIQQAMQLQQEMIAELQDKVAKLEPAAEFAYQICSSKDAIDIGNCAKVLNRNIGRNRLFEFLRNKNILQQDNIPYQKYIDSGYFRVIETKFTIPSGETKISLKTLVLQKGVAYINKLLKEEHNENKSVC
jgi:phage antirepressor YoqD-like protein